jgi:hypothetical protein
MTAQKGSGSFPVVKQSDCFTPGKEPQYCGKEKILFPPPGFDSRTVQFVASCYTEFAVPTAIVYEVYI